MDANLHSSMAISLAKSAGGYGNFVGASVRRFHTPPAPGSLHAVDAIIT
jgi:hypothetical protein